MAKPTPKTRAARRSAQQIARDDAARLERLAAETTKAEAEHAALTALLTYQSAHPLLAQEPLELEA